VREIIVSALTTRGWSVVDAATGEAALDLFANRQVDVLVTDIKLAGRMNGWEVAHAIRATQPDLPVIYASANASDPSRRVEGSLFFGKPCDPDQIVEACQRLASAYDEATELK
jgi:CheY-like chemotaxis protein